MKKITLTKAEAQHLREIYEEELKKAIERVEHLTSILKKIGPDLSIPEIPEKIAVEDAKAFLAKEPKAKKEVKTVSKTVAKVRTSKRKTRKPGAKKGKVKWNDFVFNTVEKIGKPVKSAEIADEVVKELKTHGSDVSRVSQTVSVALSKLVTAEKRLVAKKVEGVRQKEYGLPEWYDSEGNLLI